MVAAGLGCQTGETQGEIAQLRGEIVELRAEVRRLHAAFASPEPQPAETQESTAAVVDETAWRRIDLPRASVEFPGVPRRRTSTLDGWQEDGAERDLSEAYAALGASGSVLEYTQSLESGTELVATEISIRGGPRETLSHRLSVLRAKILRAAPSTLLGETSPKGTKRPTTEMTVRHADGSTSKILIAVGPARPGQPTESPDAVAYVFRAVWNDADEAPEAAQRFLKSVELR
ncbi:MAG: hypothetical protein AAGA54_19840 [Myxococcota bacterium]